MLLNGYYAGAADTAFLYNLGSPAQGTTHSELDPPISIINQELVRKYSKDMSTGQSDGGYSSIEGLSSQFFSH